MVVICSSLNFVFRVILYNATPQFELPRSDPYNTLPSHFTWLPVHHCLSSLLSAGQTLLTLNQWLLRVFPFTGSPPLNFFLSSALIFLPLPFFIFTEPLCSHHYFQSRLLYFFFLSEFAIWGGNGNPLQYSCLGNPLDKGAWRAIIHGVTKSWTELSN